MAVISLDFWSVATCPSAIPSSCRTYARAESDIVRVNRASSDVVSWSARATGTVWPFALLPAATGSVIPASASISDSSFRSDCTY